MNKSYNYSWSDDELVRLWKQLGDIPIDKKGNLGNDLLVNGYVFFPKGTSRKDVYHWFDKRHSLGVYKLMQSSKNMIFTVTLDVATPNFNIGDRVILDRFEPEETEYYNIPGTVKDISLTLAWRDEFHLADPKYHFYIQANKYVAWTVHVQFDGSDKIETVFHNNLVHYDSPKE